ncbi:hypothetical protein cyc_08837, partial [Cyclospora cayetanensis]
MQHVTLLQRSLFSKNTSTAADDMETDGPESSSSSTSKNLISSVRTLKTIQKKKAVSGSALGGSGIAKKAARASLNPQKPQIPPKEALRKGLVSPKVVPSRLKSIVRRANKRI